MRKLWLVFFVVGVAAGAACSNDAACVDDPNSSNACPPVEGTYSMSYGAETDSDGCMTMGIPAGQPLPTTLVLARGGSNLHTTVNGADLSGQVLDDFQFTLHGSSGTDIDDGGNLVGREIDTDVRGTFAFGANDAGGTITGTWQTTDTTADCNRSSPFTGAKF